MSNEDKVLTEEEYSALVKELKDHLKPGDTVYTKLNHVSRSGMSRSIEVLIFRDNKPLNLTYDVSQLLDYKIDKNHGYGLKVGGCGMDMKTVRNELEVIHQWYEDMEKEIHENRLYLEGLLMELSEDE